MHAYLTESCVRVSFSSGRLVVRDLEGGGEHRIPFSNVGGISAFGMARLSAHLIRECIASDVPVLHYSEDGHYFGNISSPTHVNSE